MLKFVPAVVAAFAATAAFAQQETTPAPTPSTPPAAESTTEPAAPSVTTPSETAPSDTTAAAPDASAPMMTEAEAKAWVNKTVYSSDGKNLGEVAQVLLDSSGKVSELHADIGGFLGIGETRVRVMPSE